MNCCSAINQLWKINNFHCYLLALIHFNIFQEISPWDLHDFRSINPPVWLVLHQSEVSSVFDIRQTFRDLLCIYYIKTLQKQASPTFTNLCVFVKLHACVSYSVTTSDKLWTCKIIHLLLCIYTFTGLLTIWDFQNKITNEIRNFLMIITEDIQHFEAPFRWVTHLLQTGSQPHTGPTNPADAMNNNISQHVHYYSI